MPTSNFAVKATPDAVFLVPDENASSFYYLRRRSFIYVSACEVTTGRNIRSKSGWCSPSPSSSPPTNRPKRKCLCKININ